MATSIEDKTPLVDGDCHVSIQSTLARVRGWGSPDQARTLNLILGSFSLSVRSIHRNKPQDVIFRGVCSVEPDDIDLAPCTEFLEEWRRVHLIFLADNLQGV
ncbi:hypothetical protein SADUNF_Sadunf18G0020600 [Salix dunnii]|uniref:Uncharacterized protein n=1 Tax=Salix dunnii TaxID=1413687 RepID=A0A835J4Z4_9ROSI|nr:hypothetical protein SADUNF_Sadunf18G0020600 [Salix dunnii]